MPRGQRPQGVTLASTYLIVMGVLLALIGGSCALFQGALTTGTSAEPTDLAGMLRNATLLIGIVLLVVGILIIGAGSGSLAGRPWARWTGALASAVLSVLLIGVGVVALGTRNGATGGLATIVLGVLFALSAYSLLTAGAWFGSHR